jgi:hypothetical protein
VIDWSGSLTRAFARHLEISGSTGSIGSKYAMTKTINGLENTGTGTGSDVTVVPMVPLLRRR